MLLTEVVGDGTGEREIGVERRSLATAVKPSVKATGRRRSARRFAR